MSTVLNPATEEPLAEIESAGVEEADAAIARAKAAYPAWRAVAPTGLHRRFGVRRLFDALRLHCGIGVRGGTRALAALGW